MKKILASGLTGLLALALAAGCDREDSERGDAPEPRPGPADAPTSRTEPTGADAQSGLPTVLAEGEGLASRQKTFLVKAVWLKGPKANAHSTLELTLATPDRHQPTAAMVLDFDPQMPSMGHGTATEDQVIRPVEGKPGSFIIDGIYFIMGGPWVLRVSAEVNGIRDLAEIPVEVP